MRLVPSVVQPGHRRVFVSILLLVALAFAGCTKAPEAGTLDDDFLDEDGDGHPDGRPEHARGLLPPEWDPFDHWTYADTFGGSTTFVITGDSSTEFIMDTTDADTAFFHARDEITFLGSIRKPDLAGSQGEDRIEFFKWPLRGGLMWNTTWDGTEKQVVVHDLGDGTFHFVADEKDGTPYAEYVYDPEVKWFTELVYKAPDGSDAFGFTLSDHGADFTGEVVRWDLETVADAAGGPAEPAVAQSSTDRFDVAATATDVWFEAQVACTQGAWAVHAAPAAEGAAEPLAGEGQCPADETVEARVPAVEGVWVLDQRFMFDAAGHWSLEVLVRTMETLAVPSS